MQKALYEASSPSRVCPHWQIPGEAKNMCQSKPLIQKGVQGMNFILVLYVDGVFLTGNESLRDMASEVWNEESWHLEEKIYIMKLLKNFWKMEIHKSLDTLIEFQEVVKRYCWTWLGNWQLIKALIFHLNACPYRTWTNSCLSCFIHIEFPSSTL